MRQLLYAAVPMALGLALGLGTSPARGQCSTCGVGGPLAKVRPGVNAPAFYGYGPGYTTYDLPPTALIQVPFNNANLYPFAGWTLYPGEAGSGVPSMSVYSHVNGLVPPAISAQAVLDRLRHLGIPLVAAEPQFLYKNPAIAEHVTLPVPKGWRKQKEEPNADDKKDRDDKKMDRDDRKDDKKDKKDDKKDKKAEDDE